MRVKLLEIAATTTRDLADWRSLAVRAIEPNPFYEPEFVLPLARSFHRQSSVALMVVQDPSGWQACLPVHSSSRWHGITLPSLVGWRSPYTFLGTPLVAPERTDSALAELLSAMVATRRVSFAVLDWVSADGPIAEALDSQLACRTPSAVCFERFERAAVRRRPESTYTDETMSAKRRREFRRQRRKLGEALDAELVTVNLAGESSAYQGFMDLEAAGWKGKSGTAMAAAPGDAQFFIELCRGFAEQGRLQLLSLQAGSRMLAGQCNLIAGNTIFCFKVAYDERWGRFSPGVQLEIDALETFHELSAIKMMDSCAAPSNSLMNRLWPDRRPIATHVIPAPGIRGLATPPSIRMMLRLRAGLESRRRK